MASVEPIALQVFLFAKSVQKLVLRRKYRVMTQHSFRVNDIIAIMLGSVQSTLRDVVVVYCLTGKFACLYTYVTLESAKYSALPRLDLCSRRSPTMYAQPVRSDLL